MYIQLMMGIRAAMSVCAVIYKKHSQISNATNKKFNYGEIVNFVSVDSERIYWLCFLLADVA